MGAKNEEAENMVIQLNGRLDSRKALKNKDPLRDDVIIVFRVFKK